MNLSRHGKWGIAAVIAVALVAAGAALAATRIHTGGPSATPGGHGFDRDGGRRALRGPGGDLSAAASYLGLGMPTLFRDLRSGKTLAQIADATSGRSAAGLIDALVAAAEQRFGGSGPGAAALRARITALVNGTGFGFAGPPSGPPMPTSPPTRI